MGFFDMIKNTFTKGNPFYNDTFDVWMDGELFNLKEKFSIEDPTIEELYKKIYNTKTQQIFKTREYSNDIAMPFRVPDVNEMRIGDCKFTIPPLSISVTTTSNIQSVTGLRQSNSIKKSSGYSTKIIRIPLWFNGLDEINGYEAESPFDYTYHIDGLRSLIAQFKRTPFLPIRNELVNFSHHIWNVSLMTMNVSTVPDFPYCLQVELVLKEFNAEPYIENTNFTFHDMFDWDVFRWYYQQLLIDTPDRNSIAYLEPVKTNMFSDMLGQEISIRLLNNELVATLKDNINDLDDYYSDILNLFGYDSNENVALNSLDLQIQYIAASIMNIIPDIQMSNFNRPTSQFMGGGDIIFNMVALTTNQEMVSVITMMKEEIDKQAREHKSQHLVGFCKIRNDIFQLFGVNYVFIETITIETVPEFPNTFSIGIKFVSYEPTQKYKEGLYSFKPFNDTSSNIASVNASDQVIYKTNRGFHNKIRQDCYAEQKLQNINLFQDLELPTYEAFGQALETINGFRDKYGIEGGIRQIKPTDGACYVDPDFYIGYQEFDPSIIANSELGKQIVDLLGTKDKNLNIKYEYADRQDKCEQIWMKALGADVVIKSPLDFNDEDIPLPIFQFKAERMCHDMIKYARRGTMNRAFPTYLISFIDEGPNWLDAKKLWSNYYVTTSALEIEIQQSKEYPNHTASILLSNTFNTLYDTYWKNQLPFGGTYKKFDFGSPNLDSKMIANHLTLLEKIKLCDGVRVHIRLGYGNNPNNMPVAFNGFITQINSDAITQIVCQSDGVELINSVFAEDKEDSHTGALHYGSESSNVIGNVMTAKKNRWINFIDTGWGECSQYGIEHFGVNLEGLAASDLLNTPKAIFGSIGASLQESEVSDNGFFTTIGNLFDNISTSFKDTADKFGDFMDNEMSWFSQYDLVKNIYHANAESMKTLSEEKKVGFNHITDMFGLNPFKMFSNMVDLIKDTGESIAGVFDGEKNMCIFLNNKTPWDVFQEITASTPDFICYPHYHQFESKIFFGCPVWNVKYKYSLGSKTEPDIIKEDTYFEYGQTKRQGVYYCDRETQIGQKYKNDNSDMVIYEHIKPFSQFHVINSASDIIDNLVIASADSIKATNAIGSYTQEKSVKMSKLVCADDTINPAMQKTKQIDTSVYTNIPLVPGVIEDAVRWVGGLTGITPTLDNVKRMCVTYLQNSMSMMYQEPIVILGKAEIKPHDVVYIHDEFAEMTGLAEVRQVIHSLTVNGYITSVYISLCTFQTLKETHKLTTYTNLLKISSAFVAIEQTKANLFYAQAFEALDKYYDLFQTRHNVVVTAKTIAWVITVARTGLAVTNIIKSGVTITSVTTMIYAGLTGTAAVTSPSIIGPIICLAVALALQILTQGIIDYFENRNVLKIMPLFLKDEIYVAGVNGQKRLVIGCEPSDKESPSGNTEEEKIFTDKRMLNLATRLPVPYRDITLKQNQDKAKIDKFLTEYNAKVYSKDFDSMKENTFYINVKKPSKGDSPTILVSGKKSYTDK